MKKILIVHGLSIAFLSTAITDSIASNPNVWTSLLGTSLLLFTFLYYVIKKQPLVKIFLQIQSEIVISTLPAWVGLVNKGNFEKGVPLIIVSLLAILLLWALNKLLFED